MLCRKIPNTRGISLLEVLISMLILAFGILGLAPMIVLSVESNGISRDFTVAAQLAKDKLEAYADVASIPSAPYEESESDVQEGYDRLTYITDCSTDSLIPDDTYKVNVIVSWTDASGMLRSSQLATLVGKD